MNDKDKLTTSAMLDLVVRKERGERSPETREVTNLMNAAEAFCNKHFELIRNMHKESDSRGFSGTLPRHIKHRNYDQIKSSVSGIPYSIVEGTEGQTITTRSYVMAGRIMFTMTTETGDHVTVLAVEDPNDSKHVGGLHTIDMNIEDALELLDVCTERGRSMIKNMAPSDAVAISF